MQDVTITQCIMLLGASVLNRGMTSGALDTASEKSAQWLGFVTPLLGSFGSLERCETS
jgi:hypothetical protein